MKRFKEMFANIKKANEILIDKIEELKEYFISDKSAFNMGDKEINKYYSLKDNEKAQLFKAEYDNKTEKLSAKLYFTCENLKQDEVQKYLKDLINYYAKVEDGYFDILNTYKSKEVSAVTCFKCEVMLDYYLNNLKNINSLENNFNKKLEEFNEKDFSA